MEVKYAVRDMPDESYISVLSRQGKVVYEGLCKDLPKVFFSFDFVSLLPLDGTSSTPHVLKIDVSPFMEHKLRTTYVDKAMSLI